MMGGAPVLMLLKASVLLAAALLAAYSLRQAPAARQHRLWSATFAAVLALPLLALALPGVRVPLPAWRAPATESPVATRSETAAPTSPLPRASVAASPTAGVPSQTANVRGRPAPVLPSPREVLTGVWLAGALAALGTLVLALARVRRLAAAAREMDDPVWRQACARIAGRLGIRHPVRVLASARVVTPMAGGVLRPTVFVPEAAAGWSDELREVVLAHEMAHLASRDPLRHLVARLAFTLYWFHPLAWLAARRALAACEQACDEAVLALGIRPSSYAGALVHFADTAPRRLAGTALPIVRRSFLEARLVAILTSRQRTATRRGALLPVAGVAALALSLAALQPLASARAPFSAAPSRPTGAPPPGLVSKAGLTHGAALAAVPVAAGPHAPVEALAPAIPASAMTEVTSEPCWSDRGEGRDFSGSMSTTERNGVTVIQEQVGRLGSDRVIQRSFGGLRVCAVAENLRGDDDSRPSAWASRASRLVLETEREGDRRRMEIGGGRVTWSINGAARPVDAEADAWRERLLALLDATWDLSQLHGRVSSLRGQISSIYGQRSSLQGEISSLRGQMSSLHGQISSLRGEESSLRGEISSIRGQESSLRGQISSEHGAISSLTAGGGDRDPERVRAHEAEIRRLEQEIERYNADARVRDVERRIEALNTEGRVAVIERQIRDFGVDGRVAAVERRIAGLDVERRVTEIEGQITALDADRRGSELEERIDQALERLRAVLGGR